MTDKRDRIVKALLGANQLAPFAARLAGNTALPPLDELTFRNWLGQNNVPFDPNAKFSDYDMRGFYGALQQGHPLAASAINPNDQRMHYPDYWKLPTHQTFSRESQWAGQGAPSWQGDRLVSPAGEIIHDETFDKTLRDMGR